MRYHCEYCERDGNLAEFCFRRKRDDRRQVELNNRDMYHQRVGVREPEVQRRTSRPRGTMPQGARPQVARPRGGLPDGVQVMIHIILDPVAVALALRP